MQSDDGHPGDRNGDRQKQVEIQERHGRHGEIAAEHVELAMGEIHDLHHAEDQRQADRNQRVSRADYYAVHKQLRE